jgi:hypothetical protein
MKTVGDTLPPLELRGDWKILSCHSNNMTRRCSQDVLS